MRGRTGSCHQAKAPAGQIHLRSSSAKQACPLTDQTPQAKLEWSGRALHWRYRQQCLSRSQLFLGAEFPGGNSANEPIFVIHIEDQDPDAAIAKVVSVIVIVVLNTRNGN